MAQRMTRRFGVTAATTTDGCAKHQANKDDQGDEHLVRAAVQSIRVGGEKRRRADSRPESKNDRRSGSPRRAASRPEERTLMRWCDTDDDDHGKACSKDESETGPEGKRQTARRL